MTGDRNQRVPWGRGKVRGVILGLLLLAWAAPAPGQGHEVHGENSVFAGEGVAIAWGILKAPVEDQSQVILRIVPRGQPVAAVRIEAVDPFTQKREVVLDGQPLGERLDVRSLRRSFADFPRREVLLYRTVADWQARRPTATIYYLGVPDTTPEFASQGALDAYLRDALATIQGGQGRKP
ncbi:MAG TPA: hypothetical protein VGC81_09560 [Candidatus Methylomirabilis sp.]